MIDWAQACATLMQGGIAVLPTDTIYGLHCLASNKNGVERIYKLKGRDSSKPFIILISSLDDLEPFGITMNNKLKALLKEYWPGPNSIILPIPDTDGKVAYLHRQTNSLAFRLPDYPPLLNLINRTGPLVSTSANPSGKPPVTDAHLAQDYFGNTIDYYLDIGALTNPPSKVFKIEYDQVIRVR